MISWWWIPIAAIMGGVLGVILYAVCAADNMPRNDGKRWWDDE